MNPVVVTGIGIVSAAGRGLAATTTALREGRSGLRGLSRFESPRCGDVPVAEVRVAEVRVAEVRGSGSAGTADEPRTLSLARDAFAQALAGADLNPTEGFVTGMALGTCVAGMPETETAIAAALGKSPVDGIDEEVWSRHECGYTAHALAKEFGLRGPVTTLSTACSSSAQAIATAADLLVAGQADVMVAGGADALCRLTLNGFVSLLNVSPEGCRPFDVQRDGMSLGEGAAFLVLEMADRARMRGDVLAVLAGYGNSCDAHHATAPHPDGIGAASAMAAALRMSGRSPANVDYVNAHGTGTIENDRAEGRALRRVFGNHVPMLSSTKRVFGHTLGAAGAIEAVVSILALRDGFVPGTAGLADVDPACEVEPLLETRDASPCLILSNSFGFGGNNSALCFASPEALA